MKFHIIESGSKGNATIVEEDGRVILIDMGIAKSTLTSEMEKYGLVFSDIKAVLFTHDHSDHLNGRGFFKDELVYAGENTTQLLQNHILEPYKTYEICGFQITPVSVSHDAFNPLGFLIKGKHSTLGYMTDTGFVSEKNEKVFANCNYYIIESNHDIKMLLQTKRTAELKQRILGDFGHLSNEDSALAISDMIGDNTSEIFLAHLSEEANTPEKALLAYKRIFKMKKIDIDRFEVVCANQHYAVSGGDKK